MDQTFDYTHKDGTNPNENIANFIGHSLALYKLTLNQTEEVKKHCKHFCG
jgi:hypothetical protein